MKIKSLKNSQEGFGILPKMSQRLFGVHAGFHAVGTSHASVFSLCSAPQPHFSTVNTLTSFPQQLQLYCPLRAHHLVAEFRIKIVFSHTTAHTPKPPFSWLPLPFHMNLRLPYIHAKLGNMPPQASSFSYIAVFPLLSHFLSLHLHLCFLSHNLRGQAASLSSVAPSISSITKSSKHKNPEINEELSNLHSPIPQGSSTSFKHYLKGRLAKSQTSIALTATVPHVPHGRETEISPSSWESNWSDPG